MLNPALHSRGVSLIELMIAIAILGILLSIAVPSFRTWILNTQIRTAAEALNNGLQLARGEAVRRNTNVQFVLGAGTGWTVGCATVVADVDGDGRDDCPEVIQTRAAGEGSKDATLSVTPAGATTVTFNGYGRVTANLDGSATITQLDIDSALLDAASSHDLRILISGGSIRFCDPNITRPGDPRAC